MKSIRKALLIPLFLVYACGDDNDHGTDTPIQSEEVNVETEVLTERSDVIWGFDFLPDGRIIFTERSGNMLILNPENDEVVPLSGEPEVFAVGEGGLLDVRLHPNFTNNQFVYFCYSAPLENGEGEMVLGRARLEGNVLTDVQRIFSSNETSSSRMHFGCRIELDGKGHLFLSLGERGEREKAQDLSSHSGKILRLNEDGFTPADNPFINTPGAQAEIFSLGHRNVQGLAIHPESGILWASELGPVGGDELNIIRAGSNYGWPLISQGEDPGGMIESTSRQGFVDPIIFWVPSISPSAMTFYTGSAIPEWRGNAFLANLSGQHLRRLVLEGDRVIDEEILFEDRGWRFRNVRQGPDEFLYFSTDEGRLGRFRP